MNDTTITITIPGEWDEMNHRYRVMDLALDAWHKALQPPHVLEVGDEVLVYYDGSTARYQDRITAIGEIGALVRREGNEVRVHWTHVTQDKALVRTKDGREVKPVWPNT